VWLAVAGSHYETARRALWEHERQAMNEVGKRAADAVVDRDAEQATCPACQATFRLPATRCPDCGLHFGD
jgi:predicted amidophosphoribosyltransferase